MDPRRALSFGAQAAAYDAARPSYPAEAVRWAIGPEARRVLDLGAGTGKLTAVVRGLGIDTVAVEPDDAMRAHVPGTSLAGTAEQIPLPDASVDAIVVGQAFHWFDASRALPEMIRVLRPGGAIGLFWNLFDDAVPWVADFCAVWDAEAVASLATQVDQPPYDATSAATSPPERRLFRHDEVVDRDSLETHLRSVSHFILLSEPVREALLRAALDKAPDGRFPVPYVCDVWRATKT